MSSTNETGHAKNVANFEQLISFCKGYGAQYNPARPSLTIMGLEDLLNKSRGALLGVKAAKTTFDNASNSRQEAFKDLKTFSTKVVSAFTAAGVSPLAVNNAKSIVRKLQGRRAKEIVAVTPEAPAATAPAVEPTVSTADTTEEKRISVSQLSYDNQLDNFAKLVQAVSQQRGYIPNEKELSVAGLQEKLANLVTLNTGVVNTYTHLSNARISRNTLLYNPLTGLKQVTADTKLYVKSIFGSSSPQYKQISGIKFTG